MPAIALVRITDSHASLYEHAEASAAGQGTVCRTEGDRARLAAWPGRWRRHRARPELHGAYTLIRRGCRARVLMPAVAPRRTPPGRAVASGPPLPLPGWKLDGKAGIVNPIEEREWRALFISRLTAVR